MNSKNFKVEKTRSCKILVSGTYDNFVQRHRSKCIDINVDPT